MKSGKTGYTIAPSIPTGYTIPWLEKYTTSNEMILYDWKLVHSKNNKIKNGLVLCEFAKDYDKVKTKLKADKAGTVYLYCNSAPTNSWGETQVVSKAIPANTVTEVEWEGDIKSGYLLWMRYLPTDTSVTSIVRVESIIAEAEQK